MKYHSLFLSKIRENVAKLSSAAVVIGALRVKIILELSIITKLAIIRAQLE